MDLLPLPAGNYGVVTSAKGKILYMKYPNTGAPAGQGALKYYDIEKREEKNVLEGVDYYLMSANRQKVMVAKSGTYAIIKPDENQKFEKPLRISEMQALVDPQEEWKQIFMDAWRFERDYFYDAGMHGVDRKGIST